MATIAEAAAIITRNADPQGDGFGIAANVSYSFWGGWNAFTPAQQTATIAAMQLWSDVAQVNFFVDNADPEIGFKNFALANSSAVGLTTWEGGDFNPDTTHRLGFNLARTPGTSLGLGQADFFTLIHEIGHAIGLMHPGNYNAGPVGSPPPTYAANRAYVEDSQQYSIMSYFSETNTGANFNGLSPRTLLIHDIAAAQVFYGANMTARTGNTVYGFHSNAGAAYSLSSPGEQAVFAIWDANGIDTLDLSDYTANQLINLAPGTFSSTGGLTANMSMADAVDIWGNNSWEAGFDPNNIANYIENAVGGSGADTINGNEAGNRLDGATGNDELYGFGGVDALIGSGGNDTLNGGAGNDTLIGGTDNDYLVGESGRDTLIGDAGNDFLDGGTYGVADGSGDVLIGGGGNDEYFISDQTDEIHENPGGGDTADKVYTNLSGFSLQRSARLSGDVEHLQFVGTGNFTDRGNDLNNALVGAAGNDTLFGFEGHDYLDGGLGVDTMRGGAGNDVYIVDNGNDVASEILGPLGIPQDAGGIDEVRATVNYALLKSLSSIIENLTFVGTGSFTGVGNDVANRITGGGSSDTLFGELGDDTLFGENGADRLRGYIGNDALFGGLGSDSLRGGEGADQLFGFNGTDTAEYNLAAAGVAVDLRSGGSGGEAAGDTYSSIENVDGSSFGDAITGDDAGNRLRGNNGNDTLEGGLGFDSLYGGAGDDLIGADNGDVVNGGTGRDQVVAQPSTNATGFIFTVGNTLVEIVEGRDGNDSIDGTGVTYGLTLVGQDGNDTLLGGSGDDGVFGGEGADSIVGGAGFDQLHGQGGNDTMTGSGGPANPPWSDWLFGGDGDDLLTATGGGRAFGDAGNDTIAGAAGDYLDGGAGNDMIAGGAGLQQILGGTGNDTLAGGADFDRFDFGNNWGVDQITDFQDNVDKIGMFATGAAGFSDLVITNILGGAQIAVIGNLINTIFVAGASSSIFTASDFEF